ncbi:class I SAM-dependent methyltransferase [Neptuniibacter pectenicola]|uniref:class I SAM-dependent methyltransferase n=1 Tax=Neptuniibacter pectenicola TaxID=1806669 RepID=UPI00082D8508|nr:class I SAM-dependent methyltransferase [Neptuniibacter pectenicola]
MKRSNLTTERLFKAAGISEGMTILELGSGPGEVTEILSEIVGSTGNILAIERSKEMISSAQKSLEKSGNSNVRFIQADLNDAPKHLKNIDLSSFDAVVGRRVLMYLPKPDKVLSSLLPWLRQNGLVVFEEYDSTICPGLVTAMPAHEKGVSLLGKMLSKEGVDQSMGFNLPATFSKAGLKFEAIWAEAVIDGQGDQYTLGELLELLKPRLGSLNVAATSEIDELITEIKMEREPTAVFVSGMRFCAKAINGEGCDNEA